MGNPMINGARTKNGSKFVKMAAKSKVAAKNINAIYTKIINLYFVVDLKLNGNIRNYMG